MLCLGIRSHSPHHRVFLGVIWSKTPLHRLSACLLPHAHCRGIVRYRCPKIGAETDFFWDDRAKNVQSVMVFRFIAGSVGSTGATMVGGTIADIWKTNE